jgi:hypothetical protein
MNMAFEDSDVQQNLVMAPPNEPSAQDVASAKANAAANTLIDATNPANAPKTPTQFDSGPARPEFSAVPPGSFGDHLRNALADARKNTDAAVLSQPGSWSKLMVGATMDALSNHGQPARPTVEARPTTGAWGSATAPETVSSRPAAPARAPFGQPVMSLLGDLAGPERGLAGFAKATTQRQAEEQKNQVVMAESNARMLHEQALTHKLGDDAIKESIEDGKAGLAAITTPVEGGITVTPDAVGKTSDELNQMIKSGELKPSIQTVFPTGRTVVGKDANGQPIYRTTYSVVTPPPRVYVNPKNAELINKYLGRNYSTSEKQSEQQVLDGVQFNAELQRALSAKAAIQKRDFDAEKLGIEIDKAHEDAQSRLIGQHKDWQNAVATASTANPADPYATLRAFNALKNRGAFDDPKSDLNGLENAAKLHIGGTEAGFNQMQEKYAAAQEKNENTVKDIVGEALKDPAKIQSDTETVMVASKARMTDPTLSKKEQNDAARVYAMAVATRALKLDTEASKELTKDEAKQRAQQRASAVANPLGLTGEAFIRTLPPGRAATLRNFANGTLVLNPSALERTDKGQAYLDDIYAAYPDLDASRAPAYAKTRINFSTGKEAAGINSSNTAIHHLNRMDANLNQATAGYTGSVEQFFGANPAGRAVADDAQAVSGELGKLYTGGVVTEGEKKEWEEKLNPKGFGMTVGKLKTNVAEFTRLLGGKLEAYQDQWDDAVPSKAIPAPKAIASPESIATYKRLTGEDLKVHSVQPSSVNAPSGPPTGATHKVPGPDGKLHWTNEKGTVDYGVVQ